VPFAKIAPDGEVIVAPNNRPKLAHNERTGSRSITSTSRRSAGARNSAGAARYRSQKEAIASKPMFLRAVDKSVCSSFFEDDSRVHADDDTLAIWVDEDVMANKAFMGIDWVSVSVIRPGGLEQPHDPQQQQRIEDVEANEAGRPATKIIAKLQAWEDAPDTRHGALSPALSAALEVSGILGGLVSVEAAPPRLSRGDIDIVKVYPVTGNGGKNEGLNFGGQFKPSQEDISERVRSIFGRRNEDNTSLFDGPLTDGLVLPKGLDVPSWEGGILRLKVTSSGGKESTKTTKWCLGSEIRFNLEVLQGIPSPLNLSNATITGAEALIKTPPSWIGIDKLVDRLTSHLSYCSSVLLTGGLGSGKSSLAQVLTHRLRSDSLYHATYVSCRKLVTDESRVSTIKETLMRLLMTASWGTRMGGRAVVVLDDLDKLCPAETELQTSDNGRSRHISELLCSLARQYCSIYSRIVILATAQGKEDMNNVIVGSNIIKEIVALKAPNKDGRRQILQALTGQENHLRRLSNGVNGHTRQVSGQSDTAWMADTPCSEPRDAQEQFDVERNLDFLDLAGQTDGYMPGDLELLVSRAKNEALIRTVEAEPIQEPGVMLSMRDFQNALKGFTPASLRNVTLQSSKTAFDSIGGLHETRKILLETLQYPVKYAPIFAQCPLRLRSGLLLYGYPGCGKTLLASAVAGECGLNFISVKGPEILNKYIGASEKSVRDLFERAESAKPCVLFFDEFDSIAPKRGHDSTGVTDRVVNQMLTQMDGAEGLSGVYVLAATSRPDLIDPALLRPGRLDKSLLCGMPSLEDRIDILQALGKKLAISPHILEATDHSRTFEEVARRTAGYSGADLQAVIYNAHLEAIHDVIGDHGADGRVNGTSSKKHKKLSSVSKQDILQFPFDKDMETNGPPSGINRAKQAAEYAGIIAKLEAIKIANKKERHARRDALDENVRQDANGAEEKEETAQKVVIEWKHIEASLASTRASIGEDERRRLEMIYREFVVGRNGEVRNGQGPTEVGGRSSLM